MKQTILLAGLAGGLGACQDRGITTVDDGSLMLARGQPVQMVTGGGSVVREDIAGTPREIYGFQARWTPKATPGARPRCTSRATT